MSSFPPGTDFSQVPAAQPPPGQTSNFIDPPNLGSVSVGIGVTFMVLGLIGSSINLIHHRKKFRRSDYCLIVAVVFTMAYTCLVMSYSYKVRHQWDTPLSYYLDPAYQKELFAENLLVAPSGFFPKATIILLYLEIFSINARFRLAVYLATFLDVATYLPQLIISPIKCTPAPGQPWDFQVLVKCAQVQKWGIAQSALGLTLDLCLFTMPIPIVSRLHMPRRQKIGVLAVFATAFFGIVASATSLAYRIALVRSSDGSWYGMVTEICNCVEIWVAVIVASAPGCASFFRAMNLQQASGSTVFNRLWSTLRRSSRSDSDSISNSPSKTLSECGEVTVRAKAEGGANLTKSQRIDTVDNKFPADSVGKTVELQTWRDRNSSSDGS